MGKIATPLNLCLAAALAASPAAANTVHVLAAFTSHTVSTYGSLSAAKTQAQNQLDRIEQALNSASGTQINFVIDSAYQFSSGLSTVLNTAPTSNFDLKMVYDDAPTTGGGFYASSRTVYHAWSSQSFGGPFGSFADQGLNKTVGLSRGAFDLSTQTVSAAKNPVNNTTYIDPSSIFGNPFGVTTVDTFNQKLLQSKGLLTGTNMNLALDSNFPDSIALKVVDSTGAKLSGARIRLYPVASSSDSVASQYVFEDSTRGGSSIIPAGIYGLGDASNVYKLTRSNLLAEVSYGTAQKFTWLPISSVQLAKMNGQSKYETTVQLPVLAPAASTDLGQVNGSHYLAVTGSGQESSFTISQFPTWSYNKVVLAFNAVNSPMSGTVYVNGNYYGQVNGWYQTVTVNQSSNAPITMKFVANNPQQINIQWWVLN